MLGVVLFVALIAGIYYIRKGMAHGVSKVLYRNTNARAMDEVWTQLAYTASGEPAEVQRAVIAALALPTTPPTAFVARTHLASQAPGRVQIEFGNKMQSQFAGVATFAAAPGGGTSGRWEVGRWTTHDGVVESPAVVEAMVAIRTGIADAVQAAGGTATVRLVPQAERSRR